MYEVMTVLITFVASVVLTHVFIRVLDGRGVVAESNDRSMHAGQTATGGGLPLIAAALAGTVALWPLAQVHAYLLPVAALLAIVSFYDDLKPVSRLLRFGTHLLAAISCVASIHYAQFIFQGWLPLWLDRAVAVFALVWFINLFNFMDGIDGIAGVETVFIASGFAIVIAAAGATSPLTGLALAMAGAAGGFLFWNWHPARIFLGDVGSVPLGFLCGALMIWLAVQHSLSAALILPLYFVADATITILMRLRRGEKIWEPHRSHFYQRSARAVGSHAVVVRRVAICNAVLVALAVLALSMPVTAFVLAVVCVGGLLAWMEIASGTALPSEAEAA
ncbi:MAG: glycosyltransferase family 4 protein [Alphaproteobacteria bacterium]|nr:glycosyltransferase family 4 protein [Alphaproteobacteria bacterium]